VHNGHVCMLFPLLDISIFDFIKANGYKPFPIHQIQSFARQILNAVEFLHSHKIIHTDLKPGTVIWKSNVRKPNVDEWRIYDMSSYRKTDVI
jgi:dual-specificity kinase